MITAIKTQEIDVSLSHDERVCLAVAGYGSQGCDIEPLRHHTESEWVALLGDSRKSLLQKLIEGNDSVDRAGTRIWTAIEAVIKAKNVTQDIILTLEKQEEDNVLFQVASTEPPLTVLTFSLKLTRGLERLVAIVVEPNELINSTIVNVDNSKNNESLKKTESAINKAEYSSQKSKLFNRWFPTFVGLGRRLIADNKEKAVWKNTVSFLSKIGYDPNIYTITGELTDTGHNIFIHRFPITFKENANLSGSVYFSNYFGWMGKVRELAMWPVYEKIAQQFTTGKWGMVTNSSQTKFLGEAKKNDVIEVRFWMGGISGATKSTFNLYYDWRRVLPGGELERVALSEMQLTWVEVLDYGVVKAKPFPNYFQDFLSQIMSSSDSAYIPKSLPEPFHNMNMGRELFCSPNLPNGKPLLLEKTFDTTLEDANLVGNIYFSNYYVWQGRIRDAFFYEHIPNYFRNRGRLGEFICLDSRVQHLREAMPFDKIKVTMSLGALYECGMSLFFDYFRLRPNGERQKLAFGQQNVIWVTRQDNNKIVPQVLPESLSSILRQ